MDCKPSLSDLQAMVHSAEVLEPGPSSRTSTSSDTDPPHGPDRSTATLAEIIAAAVTSALASKTQTESPSPRFVEATTSLTGLQVRRSPRTALEMDLGRIQVARTARGTTVEARRKIRDRTCVALEPKFAAMDFSKITNHDGSEDLGTMVLAQQTMLDRFRTWCQQVDVAYIFQVPSVSDFHDHGAVASSPRISLLTNYKALPFSTVLRYQAFVNLWLSDVDVESCDWALQVIELSTVPTLLVQIKQSFDLLPPDQQGGLTLFKLLVDKLDSKTFENTKLLQEYLTSFRLDRFPGENVALGSSCFKAASKMLARPDLPTDLIQHYLRGMSACGNEEFRSICSAQLGFLSTPMYEDWVLHTSPDPLVQLDSFAGKLESKYEALKASKAWSGINRPDSSFKASTTSGPSQTPSSSNARPPDPAWQRWFDSQTCDVCGKAHPTKYHDDPSIRNRPFIPKPSSTQRHVARASTSSRLHTNGPRFKKGGKGTFIRRVHQALLENVEDVDDTLLANLAGSPPTAPDDDADIDLPSCPPDDAPDSHEEDPMTDSAAHALAAIGLDQLLNW